MHGRKLVTKLGGYFFFPPTILSSTKMRAFSARKEPSYTFLKKKKKYIRISDVRSKIMKTE